ncbi:prepilin peptidase [Shimia sp. MIT1388]|uniref:prepilin peptidase n=1 Tax=Shimia sp. MIT1388 TaxID=3096992 RepID=UPI00399A878C
MDNAGQSAQNCATHNHPGLPVIDPVILFLLLVSPAIGSFLGVLVDRLPRDENVVLRRSQCRTCQTDLAVRDLIPLVSFALNKGCCRHCGGPIPPWVLYLEISALGAAVFAVIAASTPVETAFSAVFLWLLLGLAFADALWMRLPDALTAMLFCWVLGWAYLSPMQDLPAAMLGAALGAGSFLVLRIVYRLLRGREGLGLGDVKLMAGLGAFAGPLDLPILALGASLAGLGWAAVSLKSKQDSAGEAIPFGTMLCFAAGLMWLARASGLLI